MKTSKAESMRSVGAHKSVYSLKSLKNISSHVFEEPKPGFEECLQSACQKYSCSFLVLVKRDHQHDDFYKQLKAPETPVKYKKIAVSAPLPVTTVSHLEIDDRTTGTSATDLYIDEDTIPMTTYYDNANNLTEIYLYKLRHVPRPLMQIIGFIAPSYEYLNKITVHACIIDYLTIHELSKILITSYITDICLDGSPVPGGNYHILLDDKETKIKYLSLCRCNVNDEMCTEIASRLHFLCPAERTLLLLNLSSNHITDVGAKCLGQVLRSNRHLRYLNVADNRISDEGVEHILDSLIEFRLTYDETMSKRKRRLEYLKAKSLIVMRFFSECDAKESDEFSMFSRKSAKRKNRGNFKRDNLKKDKVSSGDDCAAKADLFANELLGPFVDPFCPTSTIQKDGFSYSIGNMVLCYLNLSYNQLTYQSIKKLVTALQYQKNAKRPSQTGLVKVVIEGNNIPISCVEYQKINDLTRLAKSMHHFSGRLSNASIRQKSRLTRISLAASQAATSGKN